MYYHAHHFRCTIMPEVVTGGATLGGAALGWLGQNQQMKNQEKLMDKSFQQSVELWKMQNAYMSPKLQMQRFAEAGLNPDLIYGKLGDTSGSMPSVNAPQAPDGGLLSQGALVGSQVRLQDSLAKKNASETRSTDAQTDFYLKTFDDRVNLLTNQYKLVGFQGEYVHEMAEYVKQSFTMLNAQTEYWKNMNYMSAYQALSAEKDYQNYDTRFQHIMNDVKARYRLNNATAYKVEKEGRMFVQLWDTHIESAKLYNANLKSETAKNYAMKNMYDAETQYLNEKSLYLPFEFIDEIVRGDEVFETDENGNFVTDEKGRFKSKGWYSGVKLGFEIFGDFVGIAGDIAGIILPFHFLKSGFTVGGAKTAKNSLQSGHIPPTTGPVKGATSSGFSVKHSPEFIKTYNSYKVAKQKGDYETANKLYQKLMRMQ